MPNYKRSDLRYYLGRYFPAKRHLKSLYKRAAAIKYEMEHPTVGSIKLDGMPRSGRISDPTPLLLERYESALEKIEIQKLCISNKIRFIKRGTNMKPTAQTSLLDWIVADNFAGGGGASTGMELAFGRPVDIAINHDPDAILMHKTNHPYTEHYQASVYDIDPEEVCGGKHVKVAWFSPDCKHFSKAKGSKPVDKNIRGLAWIVLRWAGTVRPDCIILENVEEFKTWGPVRKGKPVKSKQGQTFEKWVSQLEALGYEVEYRELKACDYGAPTIRKRFFVIARCDGKPIVWPEPTHAKAESLEVKTGKKKVYRSAAECIDFSLECPSIFDRKKPLAKNTMRRIARGLDKFVIKEQNPFIVPIGYGENKAQKPRVHDIKQPLPTAVSSRKHYYCTPYFQSIKFNNPATGANAPLSTITTINSHYLITPFMAQLNHAGGLRGQKFSDIFPTVTSKHGFAVAMPSLIQYHSEQSEKEIRGQRIDNPLLTVDGSPRYGIQMPYLAKYFGGVTGAKVEQPAPTVTAIDHNAIVSPYLCKYYGNKKDGCGIDSPLHTITSKERFACVAPYLVKHYTCGQNIENIESPLPTITGVNKNSISLPFLTQYYGGADHANTVANPLQTITTKARHFLCEVSVKKYDKSAYLGNWEKVRDLLNEYTDWDGRNCDLCNKK